MNEVDDTDAEASAYIEYEDSASVTLVGCVRASFRPPPSSPMSPVACLFQLLQIQMLNPQPSPILSYVSCCMPLSVAANLYAHTHTHTHTHTDIITHSLTHSHAQAADLVKYEGGQKVHGSWRRHRCSCCGCCRVLCFPGSLFVNVLRM